MLSGGTVILEGDTYDSDIKKSTITNLVEEHPAEMKPPSKCSIQYVVQVLYSIIVSPFI